VLPGSRRLPADDISLLSPTISLAYAGHAWDRDPFPPFDHHVARTPEVRHLIFEDSSRKGKDTVNDLKERTGEGTKPCERLSCLTNGSKVADPGVPPSQRHFPRR